LSLNSCADLGVFVANPKNSNDNHIYASFANVVADVAAFREFTNCGLLGAGTAVGMMEQLALCLGDLNDADKANLAAQPEGMSFE